MALLIAARPSIAPASDRGSRWARTLDASIAVARDRGTAAVSWNQLHAVWPARLELGLGARATTFHARGPLVFRTGDPSLERAGRVNGLGLADPWVTSVNLQLLAIARVAGPVEAGFDLDLAGVSFGPRRSGRYEASDPGLAGAQAARVAAFNLLRGGVRDSGQLNSEFFVGVRLGPTWTVRAGLSHVVTGYRSLAPLDHGNRDFERFTTQPFAGVSARLR